MSLFPSELIQYCTVRIEGSDGYKSNIGTGFLLVWGMDIYLVTNKHVVGNIGWKGVAKFLASQNDQGNIPALGRCVDLPIYYNSFTYHQDKTIDIAIMEISSFYKSENPYVIPFHEDYFPHNVNRLIMRPQEEVLFVGYPRGIWDDVNLLPLTRKGIMATNFEFDYKGKPVFLIDGSVFEGSSGSPVFVFKTPPATGRNLLPISTEFICFVGILSATQFAKDGIVASATSNGTGNPQFVEVKTYLNLGTVYKPKTIIETIEYFKQSQQSDSSDDISKQ
jgi:hypothetical protein